MTSSWMDTLPLTVLRAELRPSVPWRHDEPALALRGALGLAALGLRQRRERPSPPSWIRTSAPIGGVISPDRPLVLLWTSLGAPLDGPSPLEVLHRAALAGLGADRVPHEVRPSWIGGPEPVPLSALVGTVPAPEISLTIRTTSRLRLRRAGRPSRRPSLSDLIHSLLLRVRSLERWLGLPPARTWPEPEPGPAPISCRWEHGSRYSRRQRQEIDLSGVHAAWTVERGRAADHRDLLAAAEWLQVGSATSAGMGALSVREAPER